MNVGLLVGVGVLSVGGFLAYRALAAPATPTQQPGSIASPPSGLGLSNGGGQPALFFGGPTFQQPLGGSAGPSGAWNASPPSKKDAGSSAPSNGGGSSNGGGWNAYTPLTIHTPYSNANDTASLAPIVTPYSNASNTASVVPVIHTPFSNASNTASVVPLSKKGGCGSGRSCV